jgi:hypothetical protein
MTERQLSGELRVNCRPKVSQLISVTEGTFCEM